MSEETNGFFDEGASFHGYRVRKLIEKADKRKMYLDDYIKYLQDKRKNRKKNGKKNGKKSS